MLHIKNDTKKNIQIWIKNIWNSALQLNPDYPVRGFEIDKYTTKKTTAKSKYNLNILIKLFSKTRLGCHYTRGMTDWLIFLSSNDGWLLILFNIVFVVVDDNNDDSGSGGDGGGDVYVSIGLNEFI